MERDYHLYPRHPGQLQRLLRTVGVAAVRKVKSHLDYENALAVGPLRGSIADNLSKAGWT